MTDGELEEIRNRYDKRVADGLARRYRGWRPEIYLARQQKERVLLDLLRRAGFDELDQLKLLEVGCGRGGKLLELLSMGFAPHNLSGNELLPQFLDVARQRLPTSVSLHQGDARDTPIRHGSLDLVYQSMVFSSILDDGFQAELADKMWRWLRPGGAIVWYDFFVDNPRNADVRGVPAKRISELFPLGTVHRRRATLAPPAGRAIGSRSTLLYRVVAAVPFLQTHIVAVVAKPID